MKLAVLGAGAWGTALAIAFAKHLDVTLWARNASQAKEMAQSRQNSRYLKECPFPDSLTISDDFEATVTAADALLIVTPIAGLRETAMSIAAIRQDDVPVLWACKGFELSSRALPHQVIQQVLPHCLRIGALSGPSFAKEVAQGLPAAISLASNDYDFAKSMAKILHSPMLRIYANRDLIGVEVGGAVKNVMAIATGVCDGLGMGMNSRAALMTRGLAEITRLALAMGASDQALLGLSGVGDLILTCTGSLSRNRQVGLKLAEGLHLDQILNDLGHVAEGVPTTKGVFEQAKLLGVDMPVTQAVYSMLYENVPAKDVVDRLLERKPKPEFLH